MILDKLPCSSYPNRLTQRINVATQLLGSSLQHISFETWIPIKASQTINSAYRLWANNLKPHEKILNILETVLAATETGLLITLFVNGYDCEQMQCSLCQAFLSAELLYQGVLLTSWGSAEAKKEYTPDWQAPLVNP